MSNCQAVGRAPDSGSQGRVCHCCGAPQLEQPLYLYMPFKIKWYYSVRVEGVIHVVQREKNLNGEWRDDGLWDILIKEVTDTRDPFFRWAYMSPVKWRARFTELEKLGHKNIMRVGV